MGLLDRLFRKTPKRNKEEGTETERYWKSFKHAVDGVLYCLKYEHNVIIILLFNILAVGLGLILEVSVSEWLFIIAICGAVWTSEMINSAIEATIDLITTKEHPLAKIAKDCGSAATLILASTSLLGGMIIFLPKIIALIIGG